jgi:hypothetical protein
MENGIANSLFTSSDNGVVNGNKSGINTGYAYGLYNENLLKKAIVREGLVFYADASQNLSYPGSGLIWADLTLNQNNGTLINSPVFNTLNKGSFVFNGTNSFVDCGTSASLNFGTGNFTLNAWFKTNTTIRRTILSRFDYNNTGIIERGYYIDVLATGRIRTAFETNGSNFRVTDSLTLVNNNKYYYVSVTRTDQTTINVYINGLFETSNTLTGGTPANINAVTAPLSIGRRADYQAFAFSNFFDGNIPNVKIYNRALSAAEVMQNYLATKANYLS